MGGKAKKLKKKTKAKKKKLEKKNPFLKAKTVVKMEEGHDAPATFNGAHADIEHKLAVSKGWTHKKVFLKKSKYPTDPKKKTPMVKKSPKQKKKAKAKAKKAADKAAVKAAAKKAGKKATVAAKKAVKKAAIKAALK